MGRCKQKQRGLRELLCRWPSITEWEIYITAQGCRLRNDLYCVEWDVKLYYTIPYRPTVLEITPAMVWLVVPPKASEEDLWVLLVQNFYRPDALPVAQPTVSEQKRKSWQLSQQQQVLTYLLTFLAVVVAVVVLVIVVVLVVSTCTVVWLSDNSRESITHARNGVPADDLC